MYMYMYNNGQNSWERESLSKGIYVCVRESMKIIYHTISLLVEGRWLVDGLMDLLLDSHVGISARQATVL